VFSLLSLLLPHWSKYSEAYMISQLTLINTPRPHPKLKPSNFRQNFITVDNSHQFYGMICAKGSRNCHVIKTETRLKVHPVDAWFACAVIPALHLSTYVASCSVRMKCKVLHLYKWLNLWLCVL